MEGLTGMLVAGVLVAGCRPGGGEARESLAPGLRLEDVAFRVYRDARLTSSGTATRVAYRRDSGDFTAEGVDARFPADPPDPPARVTAPRAAGNARARRFSGSGGVRLEQGDQVTRSEEARYEPGDRLVHGDRPVVVQGPAYELAGPTWLLDPRSAAVWVRGGAHLDSGPRGAR